MRAWRVHEYGAPADVLTLDEADHDQDRFLAGETTPVMFASALQNFGVAQLLDLLLDIAPDPSATPGVDGSVREVDDGAVAARRRDLLGRGTLPHHDQRVDEVDGAGVLTEFDRAVQGVGVEVELAPAAAAEA